MPHQTSTLTAPAAGTRQMGQPSPASQPQPGPMPVISIMEDRTIVVNTVVRTREKARALRRMLEIIEEELPESDPASPQPAPSEEKPTDNSTAEEGENLS